MSDILKAMNGRRALVEWFMPECRFCKEIEEPLQRFATERGIPLLKIDMTMFDDLCERYGVNEAPTLMLLNYGREVNRTNPNTLEDLERLMLLDGG